MATAVRVRGAESVRAALAILLAIGERAVRNVQQVGRGTIYFEHRGKAVSSKAIVDEVDRQVDEQIRRAGF